MDDMDRAQALEQRQRDDSLEATRARIDASFAPRDAAACGFCIDCGDSIHPDRLRALRGCTSRCFECAHIRELQSLEHRGMA